MTTKGSKYLQLQLQNEQLKVKKLSAMNLRMNDEIRKLQNEKLFLVTHSFIRALRRLLYIRKKNTDMEAELWFKEGYFWRKLSPEWEIDVYGYSIDSKGDLIFNSCANIIDDKDGSDWAAMALILCKGLLQDGVRWPNTMNQPCDARTRLRWRWSQLCFKTKIVKKVKYRPQRSITRDPFIVLYTAYMINNPFSIYHIRKTPMPRRLFTPGVWAWRKYLITGSDLSFRIYNLFRYRGKRDYVVRLQKYMDLAVKINRYENPSR